MHLLSLTFQIFHIAIGHALFTAFAVDVLKPYLLICGAHLFSPPYQTCYLSSDVSELGLALWDD
jgi:hypothetical protein